MRVHLGRFDERSLPVGRVLHLQSFCKLPQKQYVLKVDKSLNFKNVKHEKEQIQSHTDCQHTQGV